ncbi:MAG: dicarboxylate/amino acid:cation symporter [Phycisphaerales bacterium]|nr:dicarboxylate/amino acid:cation symporter [Phycisphaerales bacterium]
MAKQRLALHWKILIGLALGVVVGIVLNQGWSAQTWKSMGVGDSQAFLAGKPSEANQGVGWLAGCIRILVDLNTLIGSLFIRFLRFIGVPVVLFALIGAVAGLGDIRKVGRVGGKTIAIFLTTGFLSVVIGVVVSNLIGPGRFVSDETRASILSKSANSASISSASDTAHALTPWKILTEIIPTNPFQSLADGQMLQVVFLSVMIGMALSMLPREKAETAIRFFDGMFEAVLILVRMAMRTAPIAVFCLVVPTVAGLGIEVLQALAAYCLTVVGGLAIVLFVLYPVITLLFTKRGNKVGYRRFFRSMAPAQLLAFSSSSSSATLPVTLQCVKERMGVSEEIAGFVCTLGTTVNMDGTALYQAVAATFLAQLYGIDLSFADQIALVLTATLISVGTPGVPGGSIVLLIVVLESLRIPTEGIAIILAVDRLLDMARTVINVSGDGMGSAVVAASEGQLGPDPGVGGPAR